MLSSYNKQGPWKVYQLLEETTSTNDFCQQLLKNQAVEEGWVIRALKQTAGRGQRGKLWNSDHPGNLYFSLILKPDFLKIQQQFLLNEMIALSLHTTLSQWIPDLKIKWPNDIYHHGNKLAGLLIENSWAGSNWQSSIIGIGINIRQTEFPSNLPNPTSFSLLGQLDVSIEKILQTILTEMQAAYETLKKGDHSFRQKYSQQLYALNTSRQFISKGESFEGSIIGVDHQGALQLKTPLGIQTFHSGSLIYQ